MTVKTPSELAASTLDSPDSHKRRATNLRRLAGGLASEAKGAERTGLTEKELRTIREAVGVLEGLATAYSKARTLAQQRWDEKAKVEKAIRAAMVGNFGTLATIPERVAFVSSVKSYVLKQGAMDLRDLDYWFREAMDSLAYTLAGQCNGQHATTVVSEAWGKFVAARGELEAKHGQLINRLSSTNLEN